MLDWTPNPDHVGFYDGSAHLRWVGELDAALEYVSGA